MAATLEQDCRGALLTAVPDALYVATRFWDANQTVSSRSMPGIARGEALTTIGGREAPAQGLSAIRALFRASGTAITLTVSGKGGASRSVTLTLRNYV